jgi:hypothetical protein
VETEESTGWAIGRSGRSVDTEKQNGTMSMVKTRAEKEIVQINTCKWRIRNKHIEKNLSVDRN